MRISGRVGGLVAFALLISAVGCGGPSDVPPLGEVSGRVTLDGQPLEGVNVIFIPVDGGRQSTGTTDADGNYALIYSIQEMGAKTGEHKVKIAFPDIMDDSGKMPKRVPIPKRYNSETQLTAKVEGGDNTHDFALMGK